MKSLPVRRAAPRDLPLLLALEALCFPEERRESPASWRRSLGSPHQSVWIARAPGAAAAAMTLRHHRGTLPIFSNAVHPELRGHRLGSALLDRAFATARRLGVARLSLEAEASDRRLVDWYAARGFRTVETLPGYYGPGLDAVRMRCCLPSGTMVKTAPC
ncbi:MAG: N-acetyltransferase [Kiritimatiellia bacterium]